MAETNGQSCLEKRGIEERNVEIVRNDYQRDDNEYSVEHKDALSDGDSRGKGTGHGGHTHWLPDCSGPIGMINYSNFDTFNGGDVYDINGRNDVGGRLKAMTYSLYNQNNQYSSISVSTELNRIEGQYYVQ